MARMDELEHDTLQDGVPAAKAAKPKPDPKEPSLREARKAVRASVLGDKAGTGEWNHMDNPAIWEGDVSDLMEE